MMRPGSERGTCRDLACLDGQEKQYWHELGSMEERDRHISIQSHRSFEYGSIQPPAIR